jgi:hypothetical protein
MHSIAKLTTAGVIALTLGFAPMARAQSQPSGTTASQPPSASSQTASQQPAEAGDRNQQAARQHLTAARQSLEEMTKLPAATQLQGEQRTMVTEFITNFNAFATATTDWRGKYLAVDKSLDRILNTAGTGTSAGSEPPADPSAAVGTSGTAAAAGTAGTTEAAGAAGAFDPGIIAKLREVRTHLDAFEEASGDPIFIVDRLENALNDAVNGSGSSGASAAVGTSGTTGASAGGTVTIDQSKLNEIRRQIERLRKSLEK